ncbi:MAG: hypothetical protein A3C50_03220 [Candidatus Staskawiczbacteria bacterium RIFCSPHIGHO2_02_FULL_43_16]|nr:MAG: hypothetical protein A3C50_03220 [Candidatus Staskawiczbacteria bacterium RIFCSPHIGHO2_02_FULL_43_16]OGZ75175.1 MAG: hypothetical protein A3A12_01145 [Candidatus Staskawiczbacteria bacterium RIFCSPLOWO2_01_FULL_43_17b]
MNMNISTVRGVFTRIGQVSKDLFAPHQGNAFRPRFLQSNILLWAVCLILVLKIVSIGLYLPAPYNWFFADVTKTDLLHLLNQNRQSLGLTTLAENETLNEAAYLKAQDMIANGYFAHQSPTGTTPWFWFKKAGYAYKYAGENLAVGFADSSTVYDAWFNSPSHKQNLLNKNYTQIGTAVVTGFQGNSTIVVQLFGTPQVTTAASNPKSQLPLGHSPLGRSPTGEPTGEANSNQTPSPNNPNQPAVQPVANTVAAPISVPEAAPEPQPMPTQPQNNAPKVLAESTEQFVGPQFAGKQSAYLQMLNFIVYDNNTILQYLSLGVLAIILMCLGINTILMFQMQNRVILVRPLVLVAILGVVLFLDKSTISHVLPYQVII